MTIKNVPTTANVTNNNKISHEYTIFFSAIRSAIIKLSELLDMDLIEDAPDDGKIYIRKNRAWVEMNLIEDAPQDGNTYGRKDGAWVVLP